MLCIYYKTSFLLFQYGLYVVIEIFLSACLKNYSRSFFFFQQDCSHTKNRLQVPRFEGIAACYHLPYFIFQDTWSSFLLCHCLKCLVQILNDICHILGTDRQADRVRLDALIGQLLISALAVSRGRRMDDQRLHVCYVCKQREQFQIVDKFFRRLSVALNLKGEDGTAAVREIFLIQLLLYRIVGNRRMMYFFYLRMAVQVLYYLECIFYVALNAKR